MANRLQSAAIEMQIAKNTNIESFLSDSPAPNPKRFLIKGMVCGVRVENILDPIMKDIRYIDKLIDELAKGKPLEKILDR